MYYNFYKPHIDLSDYVMFIWCMEYKHTNNQICTGRIVPSGCVELMFYFGDAIQINDNQGNQQVKSFGIISGQKSNYFDYKGGKHSGIISFSLKPAGCKTLLGIPANEVANLHIDTSNIFGKDAEELKEKIYLAKSNIERIDIIQKYLLTLLLKRKENNPRIVEFVNKISKSGGQIKIDKLAEQLNISKRQLERKVLENIGLTPKEFAKVIRFQKLLFLKQKNNSLKLTQLAYSAGYADQAHFSNDFKSLTGLTPSKYFSECSAISDYYSFL